MKIVHIHWGLNTGGTENMLVDIINEQVKTEDVNLIVVNNTINQDLMNRLSPQCHFFSCHRKIKSKSPLPLIKLNYYLWKIKPDIIHVHASGIIHFIFAKGIKVRTIHSTLNKSDEYHRYKALYAISNAVKKFTKKQGFTAITVLNGINILDIRNQNIANRKDTYKIVQVSRLRHEDKGQDILIKALDILHKKEKNNIEIYFIGDGTSRTYLENLTKKYMLTPFIHFMGNKDRNYIYQNLCNFDLFVQPSINEGFGLTITEAMAAKIPVLVSNIEGPMEMIKYGKYGYCFEVGNAQDCAEKIASIMQKDNKQLVENAYQHILHTYDVKITAQRYIDEYKKLLYPPQCK